MGALFGGYLSQKNNVYLVDVDAARIGEIKKSGVRVREKDGSVGVYYPNRFEVFNRSAIGHLYLGYRKGSELAKELSYESTLETYPSTRNELLVRYTQYNGIKVAKSSSSSLLI